MEDPVERTVRRALCEAGIGTPAEAGGPYLEGAPRDRGAPVPKDQLRAARAALKGLRRGELRGVSVELSASPSQRGPVLTAEWTGAAEGSAAWRIADLVASKA